MITRLTTKQERVMEQYRNKWLAIGLATGPADMDRAKVAIAAAYRIASLDPPAIYLHMQSPISGAMAATILRNQVGAQVWAQVRNQVRNQVGDQVWAQVGAQVWDQVRNQVRNQVGDQVWDQVGAQVWAQVWDQVGDQVGAQVWAQVWDQVGAQVWAQVWDQVGAQVWDQVWDQVGAQVWDQVWDQVYGCHDAPWLGFYDYIGHLGVDVSRLAPLMALAEVCGWWAPYRGVAIVQDRPEHIALVNGRLHCDGGPAIRYGDGFSVWALHGVRVPQWLAETPSGSIGAHRVAEIDNAQVRTEFVRKIGLERMLHQLGGTVLDSCDVCLRTPADNEWQCHYELVEMTLGSVKRRAMKMPNASVPDLWHVEYVPGDCRTVQEAMNFRLNRTEIEIDDVNGQPYWLHGDVIVRPQGARTWKRYPELIA